MPNGARRPDLPERDLLGIEPKKNAATIIDHLERNEQWLTNFPTFLIDYGALEPLIDEETMHLHHEKHHNTYVTNLTAAGEASRG